MKELFRTIASILAVLLLIGIGEVLPPLQALERWMLDRRLACFLVVFGCFIVGLMIFLGGMLSRMMGSGAPLSHREVEDSVRRVKDAARLPYTWRKSAYRIAGATAGAGVHEELLFREVKDAWRRRAWRHEPYWRGFFIIASGALLLVLGVFGVPFVLGPASLKLLFGGALLYALLRTTRAFLRA